MEELAVRDLPLPERQYPVGEDGPDARLKLDFAWPLLMYCVEIDGGNWRALAHTRAADYKRRRAITDNQWRSYPFHSDEIRDELDRVVGRNCAPGSKPPGLYRPVAGIRAAERQSPDELMADSESSPRSPADPEFVALAERVGVQTRAKGLQTAIGGYLLRHDLDREIQKQGFSPLLAAKLQADSFVQALYEARLDRLRQASETLDGPVLRGLALLNPAVYARMSTVAGRTCRK